MDESIRVHIVKDKDRKNLSMRYVCPLTGKLVKRTTGTSNRKESEKVAAKWEAELQEGRYDTSGRMGWEEFREYHETNAQASLRKKTNQGYATCFNAFEKHCRPKRASDLNSARVTAYAAALRRQGLSEATVAGHLRYLKSIARWANRQGLLTKVPAFDMPKGSDSAKMKGRPITLEEFERMLEVVPDIVGDNAAESWCYLLNGLWWSGLRLSEAMALRWDHNAGGVSVILDGKHSVLAFDGDSQKSGKTQQVPMAPEFYQLIESNARTHGFVFKPKQIRGEGAMARHALKIGKIISSIGDKAGVVVNPESGKTASAHDLRRSFGFRWSRRVEAPADLMELMRHASIETTMTYYVGKDARTTAARLWDASGTILGTSGIKAADQAKQQRDKALEK